MEKLVSAREDGNEATVREALAAGKIRLDDAADRPSWFTPLHAAARCGRATVLHLLLDGGAVVDLQDEEGQTWLFGFEDVRLSALVWTGDPNKPLERVRVHWQYFFVHGFPDCLFDRLVLMTYSPQMRRDVGPDRKLYANDGVYASRVMVSRDSHTLQRVLQLEAILSAEATDLGADSLWEAFNRLSAGVVDVVSQYPDLEVTSVALDRDFSTLCELPLAKQPHKWMPHAASWDTYKRRISAESATRPRRPFGKWTARTRTSAR